MSKLIAKFVALRWDRKGATAIEYAMIAGVIALGIIGAVTQIGQKSNANFERVHEGFE